MITPEICRCFFTAILWNSIRISPESGLTAWWKASKTILKMISSAFSMTSWLGRFVLNLSYNHLPYWKSPLKAGFSAAVFNRGLQNYPHFYWDNYILTEICCIIKLSVILWQVDESIYHGQTQLLSHLLKVFIQSDITQCGSLTVLEFRWVTTHMSSVEIYMIVIQSHSIKNMWLL